MTTVDVAKVFDTLLSAPGKNEMVKIDLKISRKNVLLLSHVLARGLHAEDSESKTGLLAGVPQQSLEELTLIADDCLQKSGLSEFSEKLKTLSSSK